MSILRRTNPIPQYDETAKRYGQPPLPQEKYDDVKDLGRLVNLPDQAFHRDVDKIVLAAASTVPAAVKPAIVAPPTIYGPGRGPGNQRSIQVYQLARFGLRKGYVPYVGTGAVEWDNVHVHDLSDLLVTLVEAALDPRRSGDAEVFGPRAYFLAENGTHSWGEVARWVADEAHRQGFLPEASVRQTDMEGIKLDGVSNASWGTNSKGTATRARKYLGWDPKGRSLKEEIPDIVASEAAKLGIKPTK